MAIRLGSLFDGIGAFPLSASKYGIKAVWASEIEPFPIKVTQYHFPDMKHIGDVTKINGADIEPVHIITFGSPCQDLSVAGKRGGLQGERSGLFSHATRIIREMRGSTRGQFPRFAIWENVPGAFSSNKGQDFRAVLSEIAEAEIPMPASGKWAEAGMVRTERVDIAWRVLDAQYWGVPQRRKRIFLVADFRGRCASEILFKSESVSGNLTESGEAREEAAATTRDGVEGTIFAIAFGGAREQNVSSPLMANEGPNRHQGFSNTQFDAVCIRMREGSDGGGKGPLIEPQLYDMTHAEEVIRPIKKGLAPTLNARMGTGGNQVPLVMREVSRTLRAGAGAPKHEADWESLIIESQIAYPDPAHSLLAKANMSFRDDVDTVVSVDCRNLCENEELSGTIQAKENGGYSLNYQNPVRVGYAVRRLTPLECERLMGFPDGWTDIPGASDTARYKALGNSIAIPCLDYIFQSMSEVLREGRA